MIPWKKGKPLVWDATCPDTLALSYHSQATSSAGAVADLAEGKKADKYSSLGVGYSFTPIAIETFGAMGKKTLSLLKELGHRVRRCTGEVKEKAFLLQRLSVAVQRRNTASVLGSVGLPAGTGISVLMFFFAIVILIGIVISPFTRLYLFIFPSPAVFVLFVISPLVFPLYTVLFIFIYFYTSFYTTYIIIIIVVVKVSCHVF